MANGKTHVTNRFSPELALVDRDLADVLRGFLPAPGDCLTRPAQEADDAPAPPVADVAEVIALRPVAPAPTDPEPRPTIAPVEPPPLASVPTTVPELVTPRATAPVEVARPAGPTVVAPAPVPAAAQPPRDRPRRGWIRRHTAHLVAWIVALAILAVPLLAFVPPSDSLRPRILDGASSDEPEAPPLVSGRKEPSAPPKAPTTKRSEPAEKKRTAAPPQTKTSPPQTKTTSPKARTTEPAKAPARKAPTTRANAPKADVATTPPAAPTKTPSGDKGTSSNQKTPRATSEPVVQRLGWEKVAGADLYNVVLVRDGKRVDRWVRSNTLDLRPARSSGKAGPTVEYRWYVYPLYREQDGGFRFGRLIADGSANLETGALTR